MTFPPPQGTLDLITVLKAAYPVGAIYISVVSTSPATLFGFGTWAAFGAGKCLVGLSSGEADFDTVEETGGEKTHTLASTELPHHSHAIPNAIGSDSSIAGDAGTGGHYLFDPGTVITATEEDGGGEQAHNNLQPYIVVYMWKRTA